MKKGWSITPLGLLGQDTLNTILLHFAKCGNNAIIWNGKEFVFAKVEWRKDVKKTPKS